MDQFYLKKEENGADELCNKNPEMNLKLIDGVRDKGLFCGNLPSKATVGGKSKRRKRRKRKNTIKQYFKKLMKNFF
jgi:hypothetical protein